MDGLRSREGDALRFFELDDPALFDETLVFFGGSRGELEPPLGISAGFGAPAGGAAVEDDMV